MCFLFVGVRLSHHFRRPQPSSPPPQNRLPPIREVLELKLLFFGDFATKWGGVLPGFIICGKNPSDSMFFLLFYGTLKFGFYACFVKFSSDRDLRSRLRNRHFCEKSSGFSGISHLEIFYRGLFICDYR